MLTNPSNFSVSVDGFQIDDLNAESIAGYDIIEGKNGLYHVIHKDVSYTVEVIELDVESKTGIIKVNGSVYPITLKDGIDLLIKKMGYLKKNTKALKEIKSPMPGLILELQVDIGDAVEKGDKLVVLEAMKMENQIQAINDGTVKNIHVTQGQSVEKNQLLIEFE